MKFIFFGSRPAQTKNVFENGMKKLKVDLLPLLMLLPYKISSDKKLLSTPKIAPGQGDKILSFITPLGLIERNRIQRRLIS